MLPRSFLALVLAAAACAQTPTPAQTSAAAPIDRKEVVIDDFPATGHILDLGGGCRGTIGRLKPDQVVAIDISMRELEEAPSSFLKIVMDASDLKFPKESFQTVTAFYSLMFMPPEIHQKVFSEAFRVLQPGGKFLFWDASVPALGSGENTFTIYLHTKLPKENIDYGYSVKRFEQAHDVAYYRTLAEQAGFTVARVEDKGSGLPFYLELRKP